MRETEITTHERNALLEEQLAYTSTALGRHVVASPGPVPSASHCTSFESEPRGRLVRAEFCSARIFLRAPRQVDLGLCADLGTLQRLPKLIGSDSLARELVFTARK